MPRPAAARTASVRKKDQRFNLTVPIILVLVIAAVGAALLIGGSEEKPKSPPAKAGQPAVNTACGPYHKDGVVTVNNTKINVEIAYSSGAKVKGLSGRPCIEPDWGMLFDFGHDGQYAFWMKDMKFPIDIIWISSTHKVAAIEVDFQPSSYPEKRVNQNPARYVLELKANRSKELKMDFGTTIHFQKT